MFLKRERNFWRLKSRWTGGICIVYLKN